MATAEVMAALASAGLPNGHAGITHGPVIEREGDVFGRTVNLAARLSDRAPDGEIYVTAEVVTAIEGCGAVATAVGDADLQGIGAVRLFRLDRATISR
jgi:adenylate cyclase